MKLVTAEQMRSLDEAAINEYKVPSLELMENAGRGTVQAMLRTYGDPMGQTVPVFVGPGNNGGDGLVIARLLAKELARPVVYLLVEPAKLKGDAAVNLARLQELPVPIIHIADDQSLHKAMDELPDCWAMVDSLFGTGLTRQISGLFAAAISEINSFSCPVVAVDIPSGLNADTGQPLGTCARADITVTFGAAKIGQVVHPGNKFTGNLEVVDIGIPTAVITEADIKLEILDPGLGSWLPKRPLHAHKGTYGHLLVVAGSLGKAGAAQLCCLGGLRTGTGLVTICVPYDLNQTIQTSLWEAMTVPLQSSARGILSIEDVTVINEALNNKQAVAVGPGIGNADETAELILKLYREVPAPMIIDADGLNILARDRSLISQAAGPRILTPHPGEMSRLTGLSNTEIQADRLQVAKRFATEYQVHLVLKGAETVVCHPDGRQAINPTGNPGMAAGGMGDVLSGIIGGFIAQGLSPWKAACLGVYIHGLAADRLAEEISAGYLASEVADQIPYAIESLKTDTE